MNIAVVGSGYVGTTLVGILACSGYNVVAIDVDEAKISQLNSGKAPFYETGLDELISHGLTTKRLVAKSNYERIKDAEIVFSCVGTPDRSDGSSDLSFVKKAAKSAAKYLKNDAIYVQKSTVPVGIGREITRLLPKSVAYVSNPEFLREGSAIYDTLLFDRIVAGGDNQVAVERIINLHKEIQKKAEKIANIARLNIANKLANHDGEYITTNLESAELIKVTANAFLALKISFANSIAKLCDSTHADIAQVMSAIGSDKRIGKAFLNAGRGYGGGCFPKDVSGLIASSLEYGVDMPIMTAATEVNESMHGYIVNKVEDEIGSLENHKVAVLGLAFKPGTSDARRSPAIAIANQLSKIGAKVSAYDPEANHEAASELKRDIKICDSLQAALMDSTEIFVATDWPQFNLAEITKNSPEARVIVDCMNMFDKAKVAEHNLTYIGVGR